MDPNPGSNIFGEDPLLGSLQDNGGQTDTEAPAPTSPAVDKGKAFDLITDQRDLPRPFDMPSVANSSAAGADGSDIGAVELQGQAATPPASSVPPPLSTPPASSTTPAATTIPATKVSPYSATLNGAVNPRGAPTTYRFEFGKTTSYGSVSATQSAVTGTQSAGSGTTAKPVAVPIAGLKPNTTYHFRVTAQNANGSAAGIDRRFKTKVAVLRGLKLSVSPRSPRAGRRTCFTLTATSGGRRVRGAIVRFAHRRARTNGKGNARICVSLRTGVHTARANRQGYRTASARVRARTAPAQPRFTG